MSRETEIQDMARRLEEFEEHLKKVSSDIRSHSAYDESHEADLQALHKEKDALRERLPGADETAWDEARETFHKDLDGIREKFNSWAASIDRNYRD